VLVISSKKVLWQKQGTCTLVDDEPDPPTAAAYNSAKGWKEVKEVIAVTGGANFLFPKDQLMLVLSGSGGYKPIEKQSDRLLGNLKFSKTYLVWYHHLLQKEEWNSKRK
jgi:hypothetical protein